MGNQREYKIGVVPRLVVGSNAGTMELHLKDLQARILALGGLEFTSAIGKPDESKGYKDLGKIGNLLRTLERRGIIKLNRTTSVSQEDKHGRMKVVTCGLFQEEGYEAPVGVSLDTWEPHKDTLQGWREFFPHLFRDPEYVGLGKTEHRQGR